LLDKYALIYCWIVSLFYPSADILSLWFWKWFATYRMIVNLLHNSRTIHKCRHLQNCAIKNTMLHFCRIFFGTRFPRRIASNQKHLACDTRTGACTMRKKHWEDRLIRAGSSYNGISGTMDTDREKSRFSSPVSSASIQRICTKYLPPNFALHCNFSLEKLVERCLFGVHFYFLQIS